jgi:hypothetical protein
MGNLRVVDIYSLKASVDMDSLIAVVVVFNSKPGVCLTKMTSVSSFITHRQFRWDGVIAKEITRKLAHKRSRARISIRTIKGS